MGLVFVPTPLGNLRDVTLRAIDTLRAASLIVAEDSRVTRRLLNALEIGSKELWTYHEHNARATTAAIPERAAAETVAIVGFVQCAVLFAAAGSLVNRSENVGSVSGPLYIPIVAFSFVPLLAPFVMFTRVVVGTVPAWQLVLSIVIQILAAIGLAWFSGRVYRVGLLLYGRFPSPQQIVAALRQR